MRTPAAPARTADGRLAGLSALELTKRVARQVGRDEISDRAAALAYYFLFSLFPTLLFLTAVLGLVPEPGLMEELLDYAERVMPADAASLLRRTVGEVVGGASGGVISAGAAGALWGASKGMLSIMTALNVAYHAQRRRSWWRRRALALLLTVGFCLLTLAASFLVMFGGRLGEALAARAGLGEAFSIAWAGARWLSVAGFALGAIGLIYQLAPAARRRWRWVTPGSVFAAAAWLAMSLGLRLYVDRYGRYNAIYGSIGGVVLLMLWLYFSATVLLIGAEIDSEIESERRRGVAKP